MSAAKHTAGPWWVHSVPHRNVVRAGDKPVAEVWLNGDDHQANARLIAAAPDLLAALTQFVTEYVELVESGDAGFWDAENEPKVIAARAAIAKARGEA